MDEFHSDDHEILPALLRALADRNPDLGTTQLAHQLWLEAKAAGYSRASYLQRTAALLRTRASVDLLDVEDALGQLEREHPRPARQVELRWYAGASIAECAEIQGLSLSTVRRDALLARAFLFGRLHGSAEARLDRQHAPRRHRPEALREAFAAATELPDGERAPLLDSACAGDAPMRAELEWLLRAHDRAPEDFLDASPVWDGEPESPRPPVVAGYRDVRYLSSGGMSHVFSAVQCRTERRVAIKCSRDPADRAETRAIQKEAQTLVGLNHPGVAQVYETPLAQDGSLCIVMEFIDGLSIDDFVTSRRLSDTATLHLFLQVCDAVSFCHAAGVIHRDLKPSNILVDRNGAPHLIDFGIARSMAGHTTRSGRLVGTPAFMSPEQASEGAPVDERSDLYSLGTILFRLLTEAHPLPIPRRLDHVLTPARYLDTLLNEEPARLSRYRPELRGDLEAILHHCLRKDPEERLPSVGALTVELRAHLSGAPVESRLPGVVARARAYLRTHARHVALTSSLFLTTTAAVSFCRSSEEARTAQALVMQRAEATAEAAEGERLHAEMQAREAQASRARAQASTEALIGLFEGPNPYINSRANISLREYVQSLMEYVEVHLGDDPEIKIRVMNSLAHTKAATSTAAESLATLQTCLELSIEVWGAWDPRTNVIRNNIGIALRGADRIDEALAMHESVLRWCREGRASPTLLHRTLYLRSLCLPRHHPERAPDRLNSRYEACRDALGEANQITVQTRLELCSALRRAHRFREAVQHARAVVPLVASSESGAQHPDHHSSLNDLAMVLCEWFQSGSPDCPEDALEEAEGLARRAHRAFHDGFGPGHELCIRSAINLAVIELEAGKAAAGLSRLQEVVRLAPGRLEDHSLRRSMTTALLRSGDIEGAAQQALENFEWCRQQHPDQLAEHVRYANELTKLHVDAGHTELRQEWAARAFELALRLPTRSALTAQAGAVHATFLSLSGQPGRALCVCEHVLRVHGLPPGGPEAEHLLSVVPQVLRRLEGPAAERASNGDPPADRP